MKSTDSRFSNLRHFSALIRNSTAERLSNQLGLVVTLFSLLGIGALAYLAANIEPPVISLAQIEDYENQVVNVGNVRVVGYYNIPESESWIIDVTESGFNRTVIIFASSLDFNPRSGDLLSATGEVQRYEGNWEIVCDRGDVELVEPWQGNQIILEDMVYDPEYYRGSNIKLIVNVLSEPRIDEYDNDRIYFKVGNANHNLFLNIDRTVFDCPGFNDGCLNLMPGERIEIRGTLNFNDYFVSYQLDISKSEHGVWVHNVEYEEHFVSFVIDGDTFELDNGDRVRLIGIDAPEYDYSSSMPWFDELLTEETNSQYYDAATNYLKALVEKKKVRIVTDDNCGNIDKQKYNRLLRYVYVDSLSVNIAMVSQGHAVSYETISQYQDMDEHFCTDAEFRSTFEEAENVAMNYNRGIWN
ncbi:MAG: thermonuclease family protein [Candidatus Poseidoniia archaeon]|nr:thermonuclease family protein [Candidatus Poseidoniia archaeon]